MSKELLIGCGSRRQKDMYFSDGKKEFDNLVTLDCNSDHNPDVVWDLTVHPLPFIDNEFDEIHAYDVLEHLASQGDYKFFFSEFSEYWRILKNGGKFFATVPKETTVWAWGDPSHKRIINPPQLHFLSQDFYNQVGKTKASDFRYLYKANFKIIHSELKEESFNFVLEAIK